MDSVFQLGPRITILPVIHGSGDFSFEVRRRMLAGKYDALAVPLPESFRESKPAFGFAERFDRRAGTT